MYWMYAGYLCAFYALLLLHLVFNLPTHPRPLFGAVAYLILIPTIIICVSAEVFLAVSREDAAIIRESLRRGRISRWYAVRIGVVVGSITGVIAVAIGIAMFAASAWLKHEPIGSMRVKAVIGGGITLLLLVVAVGPAVGFVWLSSRAKTITKREKRDMVEMRERKAGEDLQERHDQ